jgi:hypothetical protein
MKGLYEETADALILNPVILHVILESKPVLGKDAWNRMNQAVS